MVQTYRYTLLALALSSTLAGAQPGPAHPGRPEDIMALPECPSSIPLGGDVSLISSPAIGAEHSASVGDRILVADPVRVRVQALRFDRAFTFDGAFNGTRFIIGVPAGTLREIDDFGSLRGATVNSYRLANGTIRFLNAAGQPGKPSTPKLWLLSREHGKVLHAEVKLGSTIVPIDVRDAPISTEPCRDTPYQAVEREILYGGVAKQVITLQYREFVGGLARPSFDQQGTFDLSSGKDIVFKGVHLTVLDASNTGLRYVVTQSFEQ